MSREDLLSVLRSDPHAFPGGSNAESFDDFLSSIKSKRFPVERTSIQAEAAYDHCSYRPTENVMRAEEELLAVCNADGCPYEVERESRRGESAGYVFVLHD